MAFSTRVTFNDDGSVTHQDNPDSDVLPPPVDDAGGGIAIPDEAISIRMAVLNQSNLSQSLLQKWIDAYQKVLDEAFRHDWIHVELVQRTDNTWDPATEVPHFITNGIDVQGAAGYHTIQVLNGNDIDAFAVTDVDSAGADETFGHEIFELAANPMVNNMGPYFGDTARQIFAEVCDPTTGTPHEVNGVKIASWVTQRYIQGDNKELTKTYDSSRWFNERPRVTGPKQRTSNGFQMFFNLNTRQIEYEFGAVQNPVWGLADDQGLASAKAFAHIQRRCEAFMKTRGLVRV